MFSVDVPSLFSSLVAHFRHQPAEVYNSLSTITIFIPGISAVGNRGGVVSDINLVLPAESLIPTLGSTLGSLGHSRGAEHFYTRVAGRCRPH